MTLEKLIQQIEKDAESETSRIIEDAEKRADEIIKEAKARAEKEAKEILAKGDKEAARLKEKTLSSARRAVREMEIRAKEEVLQECFRKAEDMLKKLKGKEYETAVKKFIEEGKRSLGDCVVVPSREQDKKIAKAMGLKTEGKVKSIGGVIVKSADGSREIDSTFESIMERKMGELRIAIAGELFAK
ncbi:MAG: hypothetical protein GWP10_11010 [Nitrospiraceae bacterium]|nr:hypothetical protein [Nitrospiraceae bacterium]